MLRNFAVRSQKERKFLRQLLVFLSDNFVWLMVLSLSFVAFLINPVFYSIGNLYNLLVTFSVLGLLTLAESIVLLTGNFDNSIEVTLIFSAMVAAWLTVDHTYASGLLLPASVGVISTLLVGILIGAVNGFLVGYVGMQPFITTFATAVIVTGLGILMTGGSILTPYPESFTTLGRGLVGSLPLSGLFVIGLYFLTHLLFKYTRVGRRLFVVGGNIEAAKSLGVDEKKDTINRFYPGRVTFGNRWLDLRGQT